MQPPSSLHNPPPFFPSRAVFLPFFLLHCRSQVGIMGHRLPCCVITEHPAVRRVSLRHLQYPSSVMRKKWLLSKVFHRGVSGKMRLWDGGFLENFIVSLSYVCSALFAAAWKGPWSSVSLPHLLTGVRLLPSHGSQSMNADPTQFNQKLRLIPTAVLCRKCFKREETHFLGLASGNRCELLQMGTALYKLVLFLTIRTGFLHLLSAMPPQILLQE